MQHEALVQFTETDIEIQSEIFQANGFGTLSIMAENIASFNTLCNGEVAILGKVGESLTTQLQIVTYEISNVTLF